MNLTFWLAGKNIGSDRRPKRSSDWMIAKPVLLSLEWILIALTIYFGRSAFLAHVFIITYFLLIVLYKINKLYGRFDNPHYMFFIVVMGGGIVHAFIPVIGHFLRPVMFGHLAICFMVHILHLSQCYTVFKDITFKDDGFIIILWTVNIAEMIVNICFVLSDVFTEQHYIACALAVQTMALMIANLNLRVIPSSTIPANEQSTNSNVSDINTDISTKVVDYSNSLIMQCWIVIDQLLNSRVTIMLAASAAVGLLTLFPSDRYFIFIITLSCIMRLIVHKVIKSSSLTSLTFLLDKVFLFAPILMMIFAIASQFGSLGQETGVVLILVVMVGAFGVLFTLLYVLTDGQCYSMGVVSLLIVTATATNLVYYLQGIPTKELQLLACLTISSSMLFFVSKLQLQDFRGFKKATNIITAKSRNITTADPAGVSLGIIGQSEKQDGSSKHNSTNVFYPTSRTVVPTNENAENYV